MSRPVDQIAVIRENALVIGTGRDAFWPLLQRAAQAKLVLLGEASHGTHEFYARRAELTKRLIRDHGFQAVAAEADWPDAHRVDHDRLLQRLRDDLVFLQTRCRIVEQQQTNP
jgi:erythromycin esterase-like protein